MNLVAVETVVGVTQWLNMKCKKGTKDVFEMSFYGEKNTDPSAAV